MKPKKYLVTGGTGFIGSALTKRLINDGNRVVVFDNNSRGSTDRLVEVGDDVHIINGDIRDKDSVIKACKGIDSVCHLAYVNGTATFYKSPHQVLEVAVKGIMNIIDGCIHHNVPELILASSSEVYQNPHNIPTDETVPLNIPNIYNPRLSYGGGKIISELMAMNYGREFFEKVLIFRPHNVYGPAMGFDHVIPQFINKMKELSNNSKEVIQFPIQGSGKETRAFIYISDFIEGLMAVIEKGEHLNIYNIGTMEEITISTLAELIAKYFSRKIHIVPGKALEGSPIRRCPDISKLKSLGFLPVVKIDSGLQFTKEWYINN